MLRFFVSEESFILGECLEKSNVLKTESFLGIKVL